LSKNALRSCYEIKKRSVDKTMTEEKEVKYFDLRALIENRSEKVLERFDQDIFSGIENKRLLSILDEVKNQARDTFRPALISFSCEAVGGNPEDTLIASLMIVLAGAGVGIHDDIIDKSETKGWKKTILGLCDANDALLVGDLLIVKGLTAVQEMIRKAFKSKKVADIIQIFQDYYFEICEGVFMEKLWRNNLEIELDYCHEVLWKFSSDGEACTRLGGILGNGSEKEVEALGGFGRRLCYVCRLADEVKDMLNLNGSLPRRLQHESVPIPLLYAAQVSKEAANEIKYILGGQIDSSEIKTLLHLCFENESFSYINRILQKNVKEGIGVLNTLKPGTARRVLAQMLREMFPTNLKEIIGVQ